MSTLEYNDYVGSVEFSADCECFHGKLLFIRDLVTYEATTAKSLLREFRRAVDDYLETCKRQNKPPDTPFKGSLNVRLGPDLHRAAAMAAEQNGIKLNEFVKRAVTMKLAQSLRANTDPAPRPQS